MDPRLIVDRHIEAVLGKQAVFPSDYCATFADAIIREIHGLDILGNRFAGAFATTEADAYAAHPMGLLVTVARRMREIGWERIDPMFAQTGDLAVTRAEVYGHGIAVARGGGWFVRRHITGVRIEPASDVVAAWHPREIA